MNGIARANADNGALVAVLAAVVADLQMQRTIAKRGTSGHAFGTSDAQIFVDNVFEIGLFDETPFDGRRGAKLVFGSGVEVGNARFKIATTQIAVATKVVGVYAFYGRFAEHTVGSTASALGTFERVDLPHGATSFRVSGGNTCQSQHSKGQRKAACCVQEFPSIVFFWFTHSFFE